MGLDQSPAEVVDELIDGVIARVRAGGVDVDAGSARARRGVQRRGCADGAGDDVVPQLRRRDRRGDAARARFDAVITGDEVVNGKPHPEPYLKAAAPSSASRHPAVSRSRTRPRAPPRPSAAGSLVVVVPNHVEVPTTPDMVTAEQPFRRDARSAGNFAVRTVTVS